MRRFSLFVAATLIAATAAAAGDGPRVEVAAGLWGFDAVGFGDLTATPVRIRELPGPGAAVSYFWTDQLSTSLRAFVTRVRAYRAEPRTGSRVIEQFDALPLSGLVQLHARSAGALVPYAGFGAEYLSFHGARFSGFNPGDFASISKPDHLSFIANAGLDYRFDRRWRWNLDGQYGPSRSTAEINRLTPHTDAIHADFHFATVSTSVGYSF
jgi:outer membrane protein W